MLYLNIQFKKSQHNHIINYINNIDNIKFDSYEDEMYDDYFAKIYIYQKKNDITNLICEFHIFNSNNLKKNNINNKINIFFSDENGTISVSLEDNKFITYFSSCGGNAFGYVSNTYYLSDEENIQFSNELRKIFQH